MKAGWKRYTFGDLGRVFNGNSISESEKKDYTEGLAEGVPYIGTKDVRFDHGIDYESGVRIPDGKRDYFKLAPVNTVLVCAEGGSAGRKIAYTDRDVYFGNKLFAICPKPPNSSRLVFYYCLSDAFSRQFQGSMAGLIGGVSLNKFKNLSITLPPLPEQQRIVGILDEAFDGLATATANAEQNLRNASALFESHLQSVFTQRGKGWEERSLGSLCDFLNGFAFKSGDAVSDSQTQLVRMGNLYGNKLQLDRSPVFYPDNFANEYVRYVLKEGDIIMSLTGTTGKEDYGFAVRIPCCSHTLLMNQRIMKFDAIRYDIIDDCFLLHYLRSRCFLDLIYPTANGTRQANLSSVTMKLLPVPLPSLKEQKVIAATLDALSAETQRLESIYQQKLAALDELKKSLLHEAFSGEL